MSSFPFYTNLQIIKTNAVCTFEAGTDLIADNLNFIGIVSCRLKASASKSLRITKDAIYLAFN